MGLGLPQLMVAAGAPAMQGVRLCVTVHAGQRACSTSNMCRLAAGRADTFTGCHCMRRGSGKSFWVTGQVAAMQEVVDTMSRNVSGGQDVQVVTSATDVSTVHALLTSLVVVLAISAAVGWFTCLLFLKDLLYGFGVNTFNAVFMAFSLVSHVYLLLCLEMGFAAGHLFFACFFEFSTLNQQVLNQAGMVVCLFLIRCWAQESCLFPHCPCKGRGTSGRCGYNETSTRTVVRGLSATQERYRPSPSFSKQTGLLFTNEGYLTRNNLVIISV